MKRRRPIPDEEFSRLFERAQAILLRGAHTGDPDALAKLVDVAELFTAVKRELQSPHPSPTRLRDMVEQTILDIALDEQSDDDSGRSTAQ